MDTEQWGDPWTEGTPGHPWPGNTGISTLHTTTIIGTAVRGRLGIRGTPGRMEDTPDRTHQVHQAGWARARREGGSIVSTGGRLQKDTAEEEEVFRETGSTAAEGGGHIGHTTGHSQARPQQ